MRGCGYGGGLAPLEANVRMGRDTCLPAGPRGIALVWVASLRSRGRLGTNSQVYCPSMLFLLGIPHPCSLPIVLWCSLSLSYWSESMTDVLNTTLSSALHTTNTFLPSLTAVFTIYDEIEAYEN